MAAMITFESGLDIRTRQALKPTVAKLRVGNDYRYIVIGTEYGHLHTSGGDVRTWGSYSGARRATAAYYCAQLVMGERTEAYNLPTTAIKF